MLWVCVCGGTSEGVDHGRVIGYLLFWLVTQYKFVLKSYSPFNSIVSVMHVLLLLLLLIRVVQRVWIIRKQKGIWKCTFPIKLWQRRRIPFILMNDGIVIWYRCYYCFSLKIKGLAVAENEELHFIMLHLLVLLFLPLLTSIDVVWNNTRPDKYKWRRKKEVDIES